MLPGDRSLPEEIFSSDGDIVNCLFLLLCNVSDLALGHVLAQELKAIQRRWFIERSQPIHCPCCNSSHVIGKGWRSRVVRTSRGRIELSVRQVRCTGCGRTFRPFNKILGLPTGRRFLDEFIDKAIMLGIRVPFAYSARVLKELTSGTISAEGVRQQIAKRADTLTFCEEVVGETVLVDSTKVKAGNKQKGSPVHLAITAKQGPVKRGRATIVKKLIHLHVGSSAALKQRLKAVQAQRVVHDGGENYSLCASHVQRCRWHLVYQLQHYLWQDGISLKKRRFYQKRLRKILWKSGHRSEKTRSALRAFIKELESCGLKHSAGHLKTAEPETLTFQNVKGFTFSTTSPLEREVRELNRRTDVGARWSEKGIENVLKILFHSRLNQNSQTQLGHG